MSAYSTKHHWDWHVTKRLVLKITIGNYNHPNSFRMSYEWFNKSDNSKLKYWNVLTFGKFCFIVSYIRLRESESNLYLVNNRRSHDKKRS